MVPFPLPLLTPKGSRETPVGPEGGSHRLHLHDGCLVLWVTGGSCFVSSGKEGGGRPASRLQSDGKTQLRPCSSPLGGATGHPGL